MPDKITFDPSQPIEIYFRVNRAGIAKKLVFNNADGTPFDISSYAFEFFAKQTEQSTDKVFSLTVANGGLLLTGDDSNELNIILTSTHSNVRARQYYGELYESTQKITWLNADVIAHKGKFDGITETDGITIQLDGNDVNITVAAGGGGLSTVSVDNVTIQGDGSEETPLAVKSGVFDASGAAAGVQTNLTSHVNNTSNPHSVTKSQVGLGNADNTSDASKPVSTAQQAALDLKADLVAGKVPASQLPAYVDDVLEYANFAALPGTGTTGIIYITLDTNITYRWSGSAYVEISASLALGETSATAYRGDRGKTAYDHSQSTGNPHGTIPSDITGFNAAALAAAPAETTTTEGALINGATAKTTPVDADFIGLMDSAASNILKKLSWANIKATLKTYFDSLYIGSSSVVGLQDLYIPAVAMWPRNTGGCAVLSRTEIATSLLNIQSLDFDQTTSEYAQFTISLPKNWNNGTVTAKFYWTAASGSGTVTWGIQGGAYSDDDALSTALGSAQTVTDTLLTANDLHISSATSAITLAGTPADADFLAFQIYRDIADSLSADAKLLGVVIQLTTDAAVSS